MIDIILSTYNGEAFLREHLDSILSQTEDRWRLLIRDDGSSDGTVEILKEYCTSHPDKITFVIDKETSNLGPTQSFNRLLKISEAPYVLLCDQDDVWIVNKIEKMLSVMKEVESREKDSAPILLHSDLVVVDKNLKTISPSFMKHNKLNPLITDVIHLALRNNVTGCAMMCNRALLDFAMPIPHAAIMHDWWLAIVASAFGRIEFIPEPLVKYRQHSKNYYGAGAWKKSVTKHFKLDVYRKNLEHISLQIEAFIKEYGDRFSSPMDQEFLANFAELPNLSFMNKRKVIWHYGRQCQPLGKTVAMMLLV